MTDASTRDRQGRIRPGLVMFVCVVLVAVALVLVEARPFGRHQADLSGQPIGVTPGVVNQASAVTANSNVPAAIMVAIPQAYGIDPTRPWPRYTAAERAAAIQNNSPVGPYQLVPHQADAFARAYKIQPISFNEMTDAAHSGNWLVGAIAAVIHREGLSAAAVNFLAGTTDQPYFNPKTNSVEQRTLIQTPAGTAARAASRRNWASILSVLPIAGVGTRGTGIFDNAFHWTVIGSLSTVCGGVPLTYANPSVIPVPGDWANAVSSSKVAVPFDVRTHDGVDLAASPGSSVYAVTSGVVRFVGSDPSVAAAGGPRSLVLYTGNNLTVAYQDLGTNAVIDGQQVRVGQLLGTVAATPTDHPSAGPHLHLGINTVHAYASNHATWVDPVAFMRLRGVNLGTVSVGADVHVRRGVSTSVRTTEAATATRGLMDLWQGSQLSNAATLISTGQSLNIPSWGIQTAIMTAMRGSRLGAELPGSWGSGRGVLALPAPWGSITARDNLVTAARMFYGRLVRVANWQNIPPWEAAAKAGAYGSAVAENYRAMWSGAGIIMNVLGTPGTTSTVGTEGTVGGGCTGAPGSGAPTVNLSGGFYVANFNLYGCSESSDADGRTHGWASCTQRVDPQLKYMVQHGFSIVGLQELEAGPSRVFNQRLAAAGSPWAIFPTNPTFVYAQATAVLWRTDQWQMLAGKTFSVPGYAWTTCASGKPVTRISSAYQSMVLLRNAAGQKLWVISIHNTSTTAARGSAASCRPTPANASYSAYLANLFPRMLLMNLAVEAQQFAAATDNGKVPVVMTGDFNDGTTGSICQVQRTVPSAHSIWSSAPTSTCPTPSAGGPEPYDKIFGSGLARFANSMIDWGTQGARLTDHGVPSTLVTLK